MPMPCNSGTSASGRPPSKCSRSEEHTSELQSPCNLVCRLLLEKKKIIAHRHPLFLPMMHLLYRLYARDYAYHNKPDVMMSIICTPYFSYIHIISCIWTVSLLQI